MAAATAIPTRDDPEQSSADEHGHHCGERRHFHRPADDSRHQEIVLGRPENDEKHDGGNADRKRDGQCNRADNDTGDR